MATVYHTLHEQRQESNEEDQEDGHNAMFDPIENGDEVVAARLTGNHIALRVDVANGELLVEGTEVEYCGNPCQSRPFRVAVT